MFAIQLAGVCCTVLAAGAILALLLRTPQPRHGRRRGVRRGLPTEIRRHRRGGRARTWSDTLSSRHVAPATPHVLDGSPERHRWRMANLLEGTGEITQADLEALLGPRPEDLIGASA